MKQIFNGMNTISFSENAMITYYLQKDTIDSCIKYSDYNALEIAKALWKITKNGLYQIENYDSAITLAEKEYQIKKSTFYNYIKIIDDFYIIKKDNDNIYYPVGRKKQWEDYSYSQLLIISSLSLENKNKIDSFWTVRQLKELLNIQKTKDIKEEKEDKPKQEKQTTIKTEKKYNVASGSVKLFEYDNPKSYIQDILSKTKKIEKMYNSMLTDSDSFKNLKIVVSIEYE